MLQAFFGPVSHFFGTGGPGAGEGGEVEILEMFPSWAGGEAQVVGGQGVVGVARDEGRVTSGSLAPGRLWISAFDSGAPPAPSGLRPTHGVRVQNPSEPSGFFSFSAFQAVHHAAGVGGGAASEARGVGRAV